MRRLRSTLAACFLMVFQLSCGGTSRAEPLDITLADLSGKIVHLVSQRSQSYERENDRHRFSNEFVEDVTIKFLSDGRIDVTSKSAVIDARGRTPGESGHFVLSLGKPTDINLRGEGKRIHVFENGSLVFLRTFVQGGMKRTISFKKTATGLACSVDVAMMRENGTGPIRLRSATAPVMLQISSAKQTSSTCIVK